MIEYGRYRWNHVLWAFYSLFVCACLTLVVREICLRRLPQFSGWYLAVTGTALFLLFLIFLIFSRLRAKHAFRLEGRKASSFPLFSRLRARHAFKLEGRKASSLPRVAGEREVRSEEAQAQRIRCCLWDGLFFAGLAVAAFSFRLWSFYKQEGMWGTERAWAGEALPMVRIFVYLFGILLLYAALCILSGKFTARTVTIGLSVLPFPVKNSLLDGKGNLFFLLFAFLVLFAALLCKSVVNPARKSWPAALGAGAACGAACGIDLLFAAPLILCLSGVLMSKGERPARERIRTVCILLEAALCGFVLTVFGRKYLTGVWLLFPDFRIKYGVMSFEKFLELDLFSLYVMAWLVCLSCLYIFGFFVQKQNRGVPWILPFLFLNCLFCVTDTVSGGQVLFLSWLLFAAMGLQSMFDGGQSEMETQEELFAEPLPLAERPGKRPVLRPGEPIPNPLPGPKRHVRRELDYAFVPEEQQMCYDLTDIDENDDFEL